MAWFRSLSFLALVAVGVTASACMGVTTFDRSVNFGWQQNIIVWDEETQTQHFFRRASFSGDASDFGFVAPTPTVPELGEADDSAFHTLAELERRSYRLLQRRLRDIGGTLGGGGGGAMVEVIQQVDVGDFEATTLKSTDADALNNYLRENGYALSEQKQVWVSHYVAKGWYLTAFRVKQSGGVSGTNVIRMSFKTDKPFNPYYVPAENLASNRSSGFHTFLISKKSPYYSGLTGSQSVQRLLQFSLGPSAYRIARQLGIGESLLTPSFEVTTWSGMFDGSREGDYCFEWNQPAQASQ